MQATSKPPVVLGNSANDQAIMVTTQPASNLSTSALPTVSSAGANSRPNLFNNTMTYDGRYRYALGLGETGKLKQSRDLLVRLLQEAEAQQDPSRIARTAWSLAELYKSKRYQTAFTDQSKVAYQQATQLYRQSADSYMQLNRPAMAASARIGAANSLLLLDQVSQACDDFRQAETLARRPDIAQDTTAANQLNRSLSFFNDLATICEVDALNKRLRQEAGLPPQ